MDFRQCPGCSASVLDDDASECPFCGVSMSAKPAPKKGAPAQSQPAERPAATAPAKPTPPAVKAPPRRVGETVADEEDPFGIQTSAVAQVPQVAPKSAKGRMIRIQCPMCETPGFISSKMQGRDVKCCNPQCMVPVFKAPAPEKKDDEVVVKRGGPSGQTLAIGGGAFVLLGVLIFWGFFASRWSGGNGDPQAGDGPGYQFDPSRLGGSNPPPEPGTDSPPKPSGSGTLTLNEIKQQALNSIITSAQVRDDNRKAYGRRLAAEAHAMAGDLNQARQQLAQLQKPSVGGRVPYFQVEPLLLMAWDQFRRGDTAAAAASIQQAAEAYRDLTQVGREVLTAGISLAAAQAAFDQIPEARQTLQQLDAAVERAGVAALLHIVGCLETYDLDELLRFSSLDLATDPLAVAVAVDIATHGRWPQAIAWAEAQPGVSSQDDCLSAVALCAARQAIRAREASSVALVQGIANASPTRQARVQAGLSTGFLMLDDQSQAEAALTRGLELLETIPAPKPISAPTLREIHDSDSQADAGLPQRDPLRSSAVAAAQLARLQSLIGQQEAAWATLLEAWDFTAGIGPNYQSILKYNADLEQNRSRLQAQLNKELNLRNKDEEFRGMRKFRAQLRLFEEAALDRFRIETSLLREASRWGLAQQADAFRAAPGAVVTAAAGQPYQQTPDDEKLLAVFAETERLFNEGKFEQAAATLASFKDRHQIEETRDQRALQLACRLMNLKRVPAVYRYADALNDPWLTEDVLELTAALGVLTGQGQEVWKQYPLHDLQPTEKVALFRGLISGAVIAERRAALTETAAAGD